MARKFLYLIVAVIVLILFVLLALRLWPQQLARIAFVPGSAFAAAPAKTAADYADAALWVARPDKKDSPALFLPKGAKAATGKAAIFYIHPTTYLNRSHWNAPLDDAEANDRAVMITRMQASVFNGAGEIWAPRYRQATFGTFLGPNANAASAISQAYGDVEAAFAAFLQQAGPDRPIILAGHSQGSLHLTRLLKDHVAGTPLARRIVAAYVVGWPISVENDLASLGLPACRRKDQTQCIMSWQSFAEPAEPAYLYTSFDTAKGMNGQPNASTVMLCTNPLTGGTLPEAPARLNQGTMKANADMTTGELLPTLVPARCGGRGLLYIGAPVDLGSYMMPGNNYHVYDYSLFWANIRGDAMARLAAFKPAP
ncbi:MAG TPA: DUF3089 domain-containing protein [Chakrabartia sp.]|jgi:hypothetical protein|nr:DUF3089 domain-containing protein [Chakrabartia sp.]